jgi:hypothetical protein
LRRDAVEVSDASEESGALLDGSQIALVVHLLRTFERLLRDGDLTREQMDLLTPPGTGDADPNADLLMGDVVRETIAELLRISQQ